MKKTYNTDLKFTALLKKKGVTYQSLSSITGYSYEKFYQLARKKQEPRLLFLVDTAFFLKISISELIEHFGYDVPKFDSNKSQNLIFTKIVKNKCKSVTALAKQIGLKGQTVYKWISRETDPKVSTLIQLSSTLEISVDDIVNSILLERHLYKENKKNKSC